MISTTVSMDMCICRCPIITICLGNLGFQGNSNQLEENSYFNMDQQHQQNEMLSSPSTYQMNNNWTSSDQQQQQQQQQFNLDVSI